MKNKLWHYWQSVPEEICLSIMNCFLFNCVLIWFSLSLSSVSHPAWLPILPLGTWLQFMLHSYSVGQSDGSEQWVGSVYAFRLWSHQTKWLQFLQTMMALDDYFQLFHTSPTLGEFIITVKCLFKISFILAFCPYWTVTVEIQRTIVGRERRVHHAESHQRWCSYMMGLDH